MSLLIKLVQTSKYASRCLHQLTAQWHYWLFVHILIYNLCTFLEFCAHLPCCFRYTCVGFNWSTNKYNNNNYYIISRMITGIGLAGDLRFMPVIGSLETSLSRFETVSRDNIFTVLVLVLVLVSNVVSWSRVSSIQLSRQLWSNREII